MTLLGHFQVIFRSFSGHFQDTFRTLLGHFWDTFGTIFPSLFEFIEDSFICRGIPDGLGFLKRPVPELRGLSSDKDSSKNVSGDPCPDSQGLSPTPTPTPSLEDSVVMNHRRKFNSCPN